MKDTVHTCEIRYGGSGGRLRVIAVRRNRRALLADFDIRVIRQERGARSQIAGEGTINDFPRGLGVEALFASILSSNGSDAPARDENGVEVPLPERTPAEWKRMGLQYLATAKECFENAGMTGPEIVEQAGGNDLFGNQIVIARAMPAGAAR